MSGHPGLISKSSFLIAAFAAISLAGCLENTGVVLKSSTSASQSQANCLLPNQAAVKAISQRLVAAGTLVGPDFCSKPEGYSCYRRVFSPSISDGQTSDNECAKVNELGGDVCLKIDSRNFNTFEVSRLADTPASSTKPGGELNRSEYVCDEKDLKDGDNFLAIGEGDTLGAALSAAFAQCASVAPRLGGG